MPPDIVDELDLEPHPEGGYYRETWRAERRLPEEALDGYPAGRRAGTSILYLLETDDRSEWHRLRADEMWLFHQGDPLELIVQPGDESTRQTHVMGTEAGQRRQVHVPAEAWHTATPLDGSTGFSLVGCVAIPGFEFEDFELWDAND